MIKYIKINTRHTHNITEEKVRVGCYHHQGRNMVGKGDTRMRMRMEEIESHGMKTLKMIDMGMINSTMDKNRGRGRSMRSMGMHLARAMGSRRDKGMVVGIRDSGGLRGAVLYRAW